MPGTRLICIHLSGHAGILFLCLHRPYSELPHQSLDKNAGNGPEPAFPAASLWRTTLTVSWLVSWSLWHLPVSACLVWCLLWHERGPVGAPSQQGSGCAGSQIQDPQVQREKASCGTRSTGDTTSADAGGMWPFYTRDSPGLKVGLLPKLVQSSVRCFCILHFWGKRSFMDLASSICLSSEEERRKKNPTSLGSKA